MAISGGEEKEDNNDGGDDDNEEEDESRRRCPPNSMRDWMQQMIRATAVNAHARVLSTESLAQPTNDPVMNQADT